MHRKTNIAKCIYILAYVTTNVILSNAQFAVNKTDQSTVLQTETIINIHDVSQTAASITSPNPTIEFMNERSNENGNGNDNGQVIESTISHTKLNDDQNSFIVDMINDGFETGNNSGNNNETERKSKLFPEDFDFNLDDLEDLNYHKREVYEGDDLEESVTDAVDSVTDAVDSVTDAVDSVTDAADSVTDTTKFKELILEEESSKTDKNFKIVDDNGNSRNVYRVVAKNKSRQSVIEKGGDVIIVSNNSTSTYQPWIHGSLKTYQIITEMYDQNRWNIDIIMNNVSIKCGLDMQIYLNALNNEVEWALKASDSSGRYRGQLLFGNEFWVGSKQFCFEINNEHQVIHPKQPDLNFFVARILFNITTPVAKVHALQLAQCLPHTCTTIDIQNILNSDPTTKLLKSMSSTNQIDFINVRSVPGDYELWSDGRFQLLATIFIIIGFIVVIATIYELSTSSTPIKASTKHHLSNGNGIHTLTNGNLNHKFVNGKQLELHQIPFDNNNIVTDGGDTEPSKRRNKTSVADEKMKTKKLGVPQQLLLSFSLKSNAQAILSMKKLPQESVTCIHGMRVFSMLWTIMVHTYLQTFGISENRYQRVITEKNFFYQIIGNANYAVDTFFFLSGLLVTLLFLRSESSNKNKSRSAVADTKKSFLLYLYRYMRLTPAYFVALLISETSFKDTYNNSVFPSGLADHLTCPNHWWRNMLYVQNWFPFPELCMIWSWYLANDMQFYLWAIIILILSRRYFKTSVTLVFAFLLASWVISAIVSLNFNYIFRLSDPLESFGFLYDQVYTRIGPYIMGMIAGYTINRFKEPPKVALAKNLMMWIISMVTISLCIFGTWNGSLDRTATAFYISLGHTAWGFALIWITISCKWGLAEPVDNFLSYRGFLPLSRLTYCTYLIHPITQVVTSFQMQGPMHIRHLMVFTIFLGNAVISYFCAFILSVMFEAPVVRILRVFLKK